MLLTAGVVTVVFKKLRQPLVLGYILAGFLIGPYMPWFFTVTDEVSINTWSEIGIIILMFSLGLEFNLHKLAKVGGTGVITAFTEVGGMLLLGYATGQLLGWGVMDSIFLGGMLSMSSTTIIIKAFDELGVAKKSFAQLVFGTLVIEDIAGIFMMIILSTISVSQNISGGDLALKLGLLVLYLILWLILGIYLLPTLLNKSVTFMNDETLLIVSLGICFGMVLLANALGFSSALGAFLAGSLLAGTIHAERVEHLTSGVKDLFGAVFFLSVGMMIDPAMVAQYIVPILIITLVTLAGKLFFSSLGVLLSGQSLKNAIHCGCSLAQIGEFAFIIASLGMSLGVIADYIYPIIVSVSVITTLTTPTCIRSSDKICAAVEGVLPKKLVAKLDGYTGDTASADAGSQDNDWAVFMRRYMKTTLFYGVIMLGIVIIGTRLIYPAASEYLPETWMSRGIALAAIYLGVALFIRPMLDTKSPQYIALWMKSKRNRLPLMALNACRLIIIVLIAFAPIQIITRVNGAWLLPIIAAAVILLYRSGAFASAYLSVEARFLANFNERNLGKFADSGTATEWLDEKLYVLEFDCPESGVEGRSLRELGWGGVYGVNVVKLVRGKKHINMPDGGTVITKHDRIYVIGEASPIHSMCLGLGISEDGKLPTLREFIDGEHGDAGDLYSYALNVERDSPFAGSPIKDSRIREDYDCIILGLQRNKLPIAQPDINMTIQPGDLIWILGTKTMAGKLLQGDL